MTQIYRISFGQKYAREPHPRYSLAHPDRVLELEATDYDDARGFAMVLLGSTWCDIYTPEGWPLSAEYFDSEPSCRLVTPAAHTENSLREVPNLIQRAWPR